MGESNHGGLRVDFDRMSPWPWRIFPVILNPVANALSKDQRPHYNHYRAPSPVEPLGDDCLPADA